MLTCIIVLILLKSFFISENRFKTQIKINTVISAKKLHEKPILIKHYTTNNHVQEKNSS